MSKKLTEKTIKAMVAAAYYRHGHGAQVPILDLGKVFGVGETAIAEGRDLDEAMKAAIAQYRVN